jgi:hypothetical protein
MSLLQNYQQRVISVSSALFGMALLYWSFSAIFSASHTPNTISAVDAFLGSIDWIWLTGVGVLLVLVGLRRPLCSLSRRSRFVSVSLGAVGVCLVTVWAGFVALSLSSIGGMVFFSPAFAMGGYLLALGIAGWRTGDE